MWGKMSFPLPASFSACLKKGLCMDNKKTISLQIMQYMDKKQWIYRSNWWFQRWQQAFLKKYAAQHGTVILHWDLCVPVWVFNNSARCYAMRLLWDGSVFFRSAMQLRLSHMSAAAYPKAVAYFKWRVRITELWEVENVALGNRC